LTVNVEGKIGDI
jgi:hypothetical protein